MLMPAYNTAAVTAAVAGATPSSVVTTTDSSSNSGSKDTYWTKLFVGGLPYHTTDATLRDHFKVYGDIEEAVVITDRQTGKSRGYGFVIMSDRASAERACKEPNPIIDGRKANVNLAILGAKPRGNAAVAAAFPFTAVRAAGYPSLLAGNYGLQPMFQPAAAAYQPAMLSQNSLATALATQFYDYQPVGLGSHHQFAQPQAHFAQNAAAFDPYANYIAAAQAQQQAQAQAAAAAAAAANNPYAYLQGAGGATANGVLSPYAHAQTESRIQ